MTILNLGAPLPWKVIRGVVCDSNGFSVSDGIKPDWEESGAAHWADRPGELFVERENEEQLQAFIVETVNSHYDESGVLKHVYLGHVDSVELAKALRLLLQWCFGEPEVRAMLLTIGNDLSPELEMRLKNFAFAKEQAVELLNKLGGS